MARQARHITAGRVLSPYVWAIRGSAWQAARGEGPEASGQVGFGAAGYAEQDVEGTAGLAGL